MGPFPNAQDRVSNITPKAGCQELDELHTTARLEMPLPLPAVVGPEKSETHGAHDTGSKFGYLSIPHSLS